MQIKKYFHQVKLIPYLILFFTVVLIFLTNYRPGTYLAGWDNLMTEFSPLLAIKRSIHGVWQEYQGLGLLAGMGHAADLPRQVFLFISSLIIPVKFLRYFYHFLMLFTGAVGLYTFLYSVILKKNRQKTRILGSLSGSFLYLFNLATVQMFYVPYEPFSAQFAMLPWLFWGNHNYIDKPNRRNLFLLILINIFAVPQGYVGTIFLVYLMIIAIYFFFKLLESPKNFKSLVTAAIILLLVNAYWLLPNLYFVVKKAGVNLQSKSNQMVTDDNFLRNKKFGNLENTVLLKGFWFDNVEINSQGKMDYQLGEWINHLRNKYIAYLGYVIFTLSLLGVFYSIYTRRKILYPFVAIFILSLAIIGNDIPYLNIISRAFYQLPLFKQIFRTPFTKFAFILVFSMSVFYGALLAGILESGKINKKRFTIVSFLLIFLPALFTYPVFKGHFLYSRVKTEIPPEYLEVFKFFDKQNPSIRIANFPQYTFWGWTFYRWNYSGSGFLWYGIEQPVIDRTFDVWSRENENYYHEISYALYSGKPDLFEKVLEKYQIDWLVVDYNVVSFANAKELFWDRLINILNSSEKITLAEKYGNIEIYRINNKNKTNQFVFPAGNLKIIEPGYSWNNLDEAYYQENNYRNSLSGYTGELPEYYPFRSLFTGREQSELEFRIDENENEFIISGKIPAEYSGKSLRIPAMNYEETIEVQSDNIITNNNKFPQIYLDGNRLSYTPSTENNALVSLPEIKDGLLEVRIPKKFGLYSYNSDTAEGLLNKVTYNCDAFNKGRFNSSPVERFNVNWLRLFSIGSSNCFDVNLSRLSHKFAYIVKIENFHQEGKRILFTLRNKISERSDIETYLTDSNKPQNSYFIVPPMEEYGAGYILHFDNISIGREKSINFIKKITVNPIPFKFLTEMKITDNKEAERNAIYPESNDITVRHSNPGRYEVAFVDTEYPLNNSTLVLSQSYDKGWKLFITDCDGGFLCSLKNSIPFLFYKENKNHVLVNNWENGWMLEAESNNEQSQTYIIIYQPQYLEYLGFLLWLLLPGIYFLTPREKFS